MVVLVELVAATPASASPNGVVISEFRFRGPGGVSDEFVELRNISNMPVDVSGYRLQGCAASSGNPTNRATVPPATVLQPGQYFLFAGPNYSGATAGDAGYNSGISDQGGARIVDSAGNFVDGVGSASGAEDQCREGSGLDIPAAARPDNNYSFERRDNDARDTNDNAADFAGPSAGNPQNTSSPFNRDPVAEDDVANTNEDSAVNINVLANDEDPDGDTLTVAEISAPANGTASLAADGTVAYQPNSDYNGADSFSYTASDGEGGADSATVTITITPVPEPPTFRPPAGKPPAAKPPAAGPPAGKPGLKQPKNRSGCTIKGTRGGDVLRGTPGRDVICGRGGNDVLMGFGGNDVLKGGPGEDSLAGGRGNDRIYGGPGSDSLIGGGGRDLLRGGRGNDSLVGGPGKDREIGGPGENAGAPSAKGLTKKLLKKYLWRGQILLG